MKNPIQNRIGTTFIKVSDIEQARLWYCNIFGLESTGQIQFGHLYVVPMAEGSSGLVLDSKDFVGPHDKYPTFHLNTNNIEAAYAFMKEQDAEIVSNIENGHWFNFKDPDGNLLMVCQC